MTTYTLTLSDWEMRALRAALEGWDGIDPAVTPATNDTLDDVRWDLLDRVDDLIGERLRFALARR